MAHEDLQRELDATRQALRQAESRLHTLEAMAEASGMSMWIAVPPYDKPAYLSPAYAAVTGRPVAAETTTGFLANVHRDDLGAVRDGLFLKLTSGVGGTVGPYRYLHPERGERVFRTTVFSAPKVGSGAVGGFTEDITDQVHAQEELLQMKLHHDAFLAESRDVLLVTNPDRTRVEYLSPAADVLTGDGRAAIPHELGKLADRYLNPEDRQRLRSLNRESRAQEGFETEFQLEQTSGEKRWVWLRVRHLSEGRLVCLATDITERKRASEELEAINDELEDRVAARTRELERALERQRLLLDEVHHRVKNNLQVIASLLYLQGRVADDSVRSLLEDMRARVEAMASVHEQLINTGSSLVTLGNFLCNLLRNMETSLSDEDLLLEMDPATTDLTLDLDAAVPMALVVNELLTNAVRHGKAPVAVGVEVEEAGLRLCVSDAGAGFDPDDASGIGTTVIQALVKQMGARLSVRQDQRFFVCLHLPAGALRAGEGPAAGARGG